MCNYRLLKLFVLSFFILQGVRAQQNLHYFFRHINQSDGLLHNQVVSLVQDTKGFIWIATFNGLQRYDGSRFVYYPAMLSDPMSGLTGIANMYADKKNDFLWVLKNAEVERMKFSNNQRTIYNIASIAKDSSFEFTAFTDINAEQWEFGNNPGSNLEVITYKKDLIVINLSAAGINQNSFVATDDAGNYWVPMGSRLFSFDKKSGKVLSGKFNPAHHPLLDSSLYNRAMLRFVMIDSRQNIWLTTWGNLFFKYDHTTKKVSVYSLSDIKRKEGFSKTSENSLLINCMLEDDNHSIWIGTENAGLLRYNEGNDQFDFCISEEIKKESIEYNYKVLSLLQDRERNIWVGTDKGISIFNPYRQPFRVIKHEENNPLSIAKNEIQSFIQVSNGDMFLGTWGAGTSVYDSSFNFKKNIAFTGAPEKNYAWSFLQFDNKTIWMGCQHGYLVLYDMVSGKEQTMHPPELQGHTIRCMEKDNNGNIWCGLQNGMIIKWDKELGKFLPYGNELQEGFNRTVSVSDIFIDRTNRCWVSTMNGFREFDLQRRIYINTWLPDKNDLNSISGKTCQGIEECNDSILVIGTIYGGLNFFNKKTKKFTHWNVSDGLPSNSIYALKKDTAGYIWFTTDYGLYKFNPTEKKFIPYGIDPGAINASFISTKFFPLLNGQWSTFTAAEVISFFPKDISSSQKIQPKAEITGFKLFDTPVFIDSLLYQNKPLNLTYKENFFTVEFASLEFSGVGQTNYFYQLTGIDKDWVNGGTKRFASYTDMQPGEYTFKVRAENGNSIGLTSSFNIIITPPFWKTNWFRLTVILLTVLATWLLFKKIVKSVRHEAELKSRIAETEMMALRAQMNPHFIFNCINSIDALIQSNDKYHATMYLNKFAKLIRNILDSSKQNTVTLAKDMDTLKLYIELEQLRHENKFTAEIKTDDSLMQDDYKVPPLIIQPFVENAILHGLRYRPDNNGKLSVSVMKKAGQIQYVIEDNGVGRNTTGSQKQKEKLSYGTDISSDRVKLFNNEEKASVRITDLYAGGEPAGTKVEVLLKIQ